MRVVKEKDGGIVRRVALVGESGEECGPPTRFLSHLMDAGLYLPKSTSGQVRPHVRTHAGCRRAGRNGGCREG